MKAQPMIDHDKLATFRNRHNCLLSFLACRLIPHTFTRSTFHKPIGLVYGVLKIKAPSNKLPLLHIAYQTS